MDLFPDLENCLGLGQRLWTYLGLCLCLDLGQDLGPFLVLNLGLAENNLFQVKDKCE